MYNLSKIILGLFLLFSLASCSNDDDEMDDALIGTWKVISATASVSTSTSFGGETYSSDVDTEFSNLNYTLTFDGNTWTTAGSYTTTSTVSADGIEFTSSSDVSDINGSGTYTADGTTMTINGSFFEFDYEGGSFNGGSGEQTANYEINANGQLVFAQNETVESTEGGAASSSQVVSNSVWEKQ